MLILTQKEVLSGLANKGISISAITLQAWEKEITLPIRYARQSGKPGRTVLYLASAVDTIISHHKNKSIKNIGGIQI